MHHRIVDTSNFGYLLLREFFLKIMVGVGHDISKNFVIFPDLLMSITIKYKIGRLNFTKINKILRNIHVPRLSRFGR